MTNLKLILLTNNLLLVSQIEEVPSELGEPDCKLISPFTIQKSSNEFYLESWLSDYSSTNIYMIHSDKILTISEPKTPIVEKYQSLIK